MGIYASVAGSYKFGGRTSREQYIFNQQECCQSHTCINTFSLPASRDKNQSLGDQTLTGRWLQPESKPPHLFNI